MRLILFREKVLVKPIEMEERRGMLYVIRAEESTESTMRYGEVITFSDDITELKKGFKVIFSKFAGLPIMIDNVQHLILEFKDILAVYTDN